MEFNEFIDAIKNFPLEITDEKLQKLENYYNMLIEWNEKINLTGITEKKEVYLKHFYDSLTLTKAINLNFENSFCDIGTGAGFPGIVIKIFYPHLKVTLIDSLQKRIKFLEEVIAKLNLNDITLVCARAEDYARENRDKFDVVTSRAVADIYILLEYSVALVKPQKYFIPMKGKIENTNFTNVSKELNIKLIDCIEFLLPKENSVRNILKFQKIGTTNLKYPRRYAEIKKRPLS